MGSLEPRIESNDKLELKSMVEALQTALYYHKQHIASEVKEIVSLEITQLVSNSHNILSEFYQKTFSSLETSVKFELQTINYKIQTIETKSNELLDKIKNIEVNMQQKCNVIDKDIKDIQEKSIFNDQNLINSNALLTKLEEQALKLNNEIIHVKENLNATKNNMINEVKISLNDTRREIDNTRHEYQSRFQSEIFKLHEKILEVKYSYDEQANKRKNYEPESISTPFKEMKIKEDKIIDYCNSGISKISMELSQLRIRVEKLEVSEQACERLRTGRR
jgi:hypothetical protein